MNPRISFIVSVFDRTNALVCLLASLRLQKATHEVIVTDAAVDPLVQKANAGACEQFGAAYLSTPSMDCYQAASKAVPLAKGEWLCFPNDDGYYVPGFSEVMLKAADSGGWDLVYCDLIYDPRLAGRWEVLAVLPKCYSIDKTCFMVKREKFSGFDLDKTFQTRDGMFIEKLVATGIKHGKAPGVLVVHN